MPLILILNFLTILFAGLLAGVEFAVHYGFRRPAESIDKRSQLILRQAMVWRLRILVPALFLPTAVFGIAVTVIGGSSGLMLRSIALLALLVWILIRVIGTVPINSATLEWNVDSPPSNWKARVDHAERFHSVGAWAAVLAFILFLLPIIF